LSVEIDLLIELSGPFSASIKAVTIWLTFKPDPIPLDEIVPEEAI
jgi:hypothetical protein